MCKRKSYALDPGGYIVTSSIEQNTTVDEFTSLVTRTHEQTKYNLSYGGRCGWNALGVAAAVGNIDVINCIINHAPTVINLGNDVGWTPLFCAIWKSPDNVEEVVKLLVERGANVNMATTSPCKDDFHPIVKIVERWWTPLKLAGEMKNESLVKFLIDVGGKE